MELSLDTNDVENISLSALKFTNDGKSFDKVVHQTGYHIDRNPSVLRTDFKSFELNGFLSIGIKDHSLVTNEFQIESGEINLLHIYDDREEKISILISDLKLEKYDFQISDANAKIGNPKIFDIHQIVMDHDRKIICFFMKYGNRFFRF